MKFPAHILVVISSCLLLTWPCLARTLTVNCAGGADFSDIQSAINDANNGDLIIVADGTYTGANNRNIDFNGKAITLQSENGPQNCIIDCQNSARGFYFHHNETVNSIVDGFTVRNGFVMTMCYGGAGIYFNYTSGKITNCIITNNTAVLDPQSLCFCYGGGICIGDSSSPTIEKCVISNNSCGDYGFGGGIYCGLTNNPAIRYTLISNNTAGYYGGGIFCEKNSNSTVTNCTITQNTAALSGGGVCFNQDQTNHPIAITNSIIWENIPDQIFTNGPYNGNVRFSDIEGGWPNPPPFGANIDVDPCFADPLHADFHLKSAAGRWDPQQLQWVKDNVTSLCIDQGDSNQNWKKELWPHGKRINMGAYGGTPQASMSLSNAGNIADLDNNGTVDYADLMLFANKWLYQQNLLSADLDRNGEVDFADYAIFANNWLWVE